ncbi:MAG: hypothetical protein DI598_04250 [Pseudopedobacter saltans]|uniref:Uncharacterized protein n=1 Tax=Pseudopedobacter saltans TaxID=151895 RepID=A0A2W5H654_9SPHI|nr:MAG: hypothetical protein DI598_04250 [Pseudopedobacter saltans]
MYVYTIFVVGIRVNSFDTELKFKNMKRFLVATSIAFLALTSCSKDDSSTPTPSTPKSRDVKYEISGSFSGQISFISSDNVNGIDAVTVPNLPWTKEKKYSTNVLAIGTGGSSATVSASNAGKTVTLKIYVGGKEVRTGTVTADANGAVSLPALAYTF